MTNDRHDPDDDWALASAHVDGETDAVQRAQVAASPALGELVDQILSVRAALGQSPHPPAGARARAVAAALASTEPAEARSSAPDTPVGTVHALDARRRRMRWIGGAAAAAVIAVTAGLLVRGRDEGTSRTFSRTETVSDAAATEAASAAPDQAAPATKAAPAAAPAAGSGGGLPTPLATLDEPEQLLDLDAAPATASDSTVPCGEPGEVVLAVISYRGTVALASFDPAAHVRRARALDGCAVLAEVAATS